MGQSASGASGDTLCRMDLGPLPDELLLLVLSFLPGRELLWNCRRVCRRWRCLVDSPCLWRVKCERERRTSLLEAARCCPDLPWGRVYLKEPFARNLLRNPCGTEQFQHWKLQHGGDRWSVENNRSHLEGAKAQSCFVTSFNWCIKWQVIDLLKEGLWEKLLDHHQPEILVTDWYAGRNDCGCVYSIHVKLLAADKTSVIATFQENPEPIPQWNDEQYHQVSHVFRNYGPGVRFVHFLHKGKDTQFWAGHYGARISNSTVMVALR
ncbi:F-box only protein 27-like [Rhinatrema bivittatum]|uniref:F-box only protein 27-like n=1 Tax=Rhinatrema bivittatum TaxID=194408 RepID=UPI00112C93B5|nr:F-box only protein 27-like [Rhinatrema bivittatum]